MVAVWYGPPVNGTGEPRPYLLPRRNSKRVSFVDDCPPWYTSAHHASLHVTFLRNQTVWVWFEAIVRCVLEWLTRCYYLFHDWVYIASKQFVHVRFAHISRDCRPYLGNGCSILMNFCISMKLRNIWIYATYVVRDGWRLFCRRTFLLFSWQRCRFDKML